MSHRLVERALGRLRSYLLSQRIEHLSYDELAAIGALRRAGLNGVIVKYFRKDPLSDPDELDETADAPHIAFFANFKINKECELKSLLQGCLDFWGDINVDECVFTD